MHAANAASLSCPGASRQRLWLFKLIEFVIQVFDEILCLGRG